jgi:hypothetical protein
MTKAILMEAGGARILVESDESVSVPVGAGGDGGRDSRPGVAPGMDAVAGVGDLGRNFEEVQDLIVLCCNSLYAALSKMPHPDRVAVEFGVKLAGEAGVPMLTKASGEANFKVAVEWKPPAR